MAILLINHKTFKETPTIEEVPLLIKYIKSDGFKLIENEIQWYEMWLNRQLPGNPNNWDMLEINNDDLLNTLKSLL